MMLRRIYFVLALSLVACAGNEGVVFDEFQGIKSHWSRKEAKEFTFVIDDTLVYYDLQLQLRINSIYSYSNIWLLYELEGMGLKEKGRTMVQLSDQQTGKWLGSGGGNLYTYAQVIKKGIRLNRGTYKISFTQNMMDEDLGGVSDVGFRVVKGPKIY